MFADLRRYPKLVGGIDRESKLRDIGFYEEVLDFDAQSDRLRLNGVWSLGSAEAAEMAKLGETTCRDVNIGLANQFALFAEKNGIGIRSVIEACNSQPYSQIHTPGISVGGHCIPVYPRLYLWNGPEATIVAAVRTANSRMPERVVERLERALGSLSALRVAILGAAYRGGVKEAAFSGVFAIAQELAQRGAQVVVHDPLYTQEELVGIGCSPYTRGETADAVVVQADHAEYLDWGPDDIPGLRVVVDGRGCLQLGIWDSACMSLRMGL